MNPEDRNAMSTTFETAYRSALLAICRAGVAIHPNATGDLTGFTLDADAEDSPHAFLWRDSPTKDGEIGWESGLPYRKDRLDSFARKPWTMSARDRRKAAVSEIRLAYAGPNARAIRVALHAFTTAGIQAHWNGALTITVPAFDASPPQEGYHLAARDVDDSGHCWDPAPQPVMTSAPKRTGTLTDWRASARTRVPT